MLMSTGCGPVTPLNHGYEHISEHIAWFVCGPSEVALYATCRYWRDLLRAVATGAACPDVWHTLMGMSLKNLVRSKKYLHISMNQNVYGSCDLYTHMYRLFVKQSRWYDPNIANLSMTPDALYRAETMGDVLGSHFDVMSRHVYGHSHEDDPYASRCMSVADTMNDPRTYCNRLCGALRRGISCPCVDMYLSHSGPRSIMDGMDEPQLTYKLASHAASCPAPMGTRAYDAAVCALLRVLARTDITSVNVHDMVTSLCKVGNLALFRVFLREYIASPTYSRKLSGLGEDSNMCDLIKTGLEHASDRATHDALLAIARDESHDTRSLDDRPSLTWSIKRGLHALVEGFSDALLSRYEDSLAGSHSQRKFMKDVLSNDRSDVLSVLLDVMQRVDRKTVGLYAMRIEACRNDAVSCFRFLSTIDPAWKPDASNPRMFSVPDSEVRDYLVACPSGRMFDTVCSVCVISDSARAATMKALFVGFGAGFSLEPPLVAAYIRNGFVNCLTCDKIRYKDIDTAVAYLTRLCETLFDATCDPIVWSNKWSVSCVLASRYAMRGGEIDMWHDAMRPYLRDCISTFGSCKNTQTIPLMREARRTSIHDSTYRLPSTFAKSIFDWK